VVDIKTSEKPLWQKLGWDKVGQNYYGTYQFRHDGKWYGHIREGYINLEVYIWWPPAALELHPRWPCFVHQGKNKYLIHFTNKLIGVDDAIINVQRLLAEAIIFHSGEGRNARKNRGFFHRWLDL
jgi:hypothetical protein